MALSSAFPSCAGGASEVLILSEKGHTKCEFSQADFPGPYQMKQQKLFTVLCPMATPQTDNTKHLRTVIR
uniref:CLIC5 protein n=1 Tax=Homo sapiens TaxID=9606 RepID=Q8N675_HUMAN